MSESITIETQDDGTYHVTSTEDDQDPAGQDQPLDQVCKSVDEVLALVKQELTDESPDDQNKSAWDTEAAQRDASGRRQPQMSMPPGA